MRHLHRRVFAVILSLVMVVTFMPMGALQRTQAATPSPYFYNLSISSTMDGAQVVNKPSIDITGTFDTQVQPTTITYTVYPMLGNTPQAPLPNSVQSRSINGNTFTLTGVQLAAGMNQIVIAGTANGTTVQSIGYVYYSTAPVVYDVQYNGSQYTDIVYVDSQQSKMLNISFQSYGADNVWVNDIAGFKAGDRWYATVPLQEGLNNIKIVAKNATQSYEVSRQAVLFTTHTAFGLTTDPVAPSGTTRQSLQNNNVVADTVYAPSQLGTIQGNLIVTDIDKTVVSNPSLSLVMVDTADNTKTSGPVNSTITFNKDINSGKNSLYTFDAGVIGISGGLQTGHKYQITTTLTYTDLTNTVQTKTNTFTFVYRSSTSTYIKNSFLTAGINEVPPVGSSVYNYTEIPIVNDVFDQQESPLGLSFDLGNWNGDLSTTTVTINNLPDGASSSTPITDFTKGKKYNDNSRLLIQIPGADLQPGLQRLTIAIGGDSHTFTVNYVPAAAIFVKNVYNGTIFQNTGDLTKITAKFINFTNTEISSTSVYINQQFVNHSWNPDGSDYSIDLTGYALQPGANTILIHGVGNGNTVDINYTVFLFSGNQPTIADPIPLMSDFTTNSATVQSTGDNKFTTNDAMAYFRLSYSNMDRIKVLVDGITVFNSGNPIYVNSPAPAGGANPGKYNYQIPGSPTDTGQFLDVKDAANVANLQLKMKDSGSTFVTITGYTSDGASVSRTIEIVREVPPYLIVSPSLPTQRVINQNFWTVQIQAAFADSVIINKETAVKLPNSDIYQIEVTGLKPGKNTIKFTVNRASNPVNSSFDVYYANQNTIGAQYKIPLGSSSLSAFNKAIEIKFPKNTLFRDDVTVPNQDTNTPVLLNDQLVRFGIANKDNGSTGITPVTSQGPNIIGTLDDGQKIYASALYWVDAGYYNYGNPVDGLDPYEPGSAFYYRNGKWLKPTNRGDITIQYDTDMRDVAGNTLSIWKWNPQTSMWENIGGVVNTSKHTISAEFDGFGYYTVMMLRRGYPDITNHPWARDYLETMYSKGIMLPRSYSEFGVYENITRGEFAEVMVKALDLPLVYDPNNPTFYDVQNFTWPLYDAKYIETAFRKGIVKGISPGIFNPEGYISRQDAAVMIARAINAKVGNDGEAAQKALSKVFQDATSIDYYSAPSVLSINKMGIINGVPVDLTQGQKKQTFNYNPSAYLSRAEASKIAYKMMQVLKKLPK